MANPQKEQGYTPIANEVMENLALAELSGREFRVTLVVLRRTWGWSKKEDCLSLGQISKSTGIGRQHVSTIARGLVSKQILSVQGATENGNTPNTYSFNKDYEKWLSKGATENGNVPSMGVPVTGNTVLPFSGAQVFPKTVTKVLPKTVTTKASKTNKAIPKARETPSAPLEPTPKDRAKLFFRGVEDLMGGVEVPWLQEMLRAITEKNPQLNKKVIWDEVRNFGMYWTEKNGTGTKELWELHKTFEVEKRLATWFRRAGMRDFSSAGTSRKGKNIIGLSD